MHACLSYLLFMDDVDAGLDVGESVGGSENGLSFKLFVQVTVSSAVECERCAVDEAPQVVVLIEVCDAVLHFISVKIWFNVCDLNEGLYWKVMLFSMQSIVVYCS